jgi:hypothetical protein
MLGHEARSANEEESMGYGTHPRMSAERVRISRVVQLRNCFWYMSLDDRLSDKIPSKKFTKVSTLPQPSSVLFTEP